MGEKKLGCQAVFRIRYITLFTDPDPDFLCNADPGPDPDPGKNTFVQRQYKISDTNNVLTCTSSFLFTYLYLNLQ